MVHTKTQRRDIGPFLRYIPYKLHGRCGRGFGSGLEGPGARSLQVPAFRRRLRQFQRVRLPAYSICLGLKGVTPFKGTLTPHFKYATWTLWELGQKSWPELRTSAACSCPRPGTGVPAPYLRNTIKMCLYMYKYFVHINMHLFVSISVSIYVCTSDCPSVCLSIYLSVCLSIYVYTPRRQHPATQSPGPWPPNPESQPPEHLQVFGVYLNIQD